MFDIIATSVDGIIFLATLIAGIVFFLFGVHKVYEAIFAVLIMIWFYLLIYVLTFITPETTLFAPWGTWMIRERNVILLWINIMMVFLYFFTPFSIGLNVGWVVRGTFWYFLKLIFLSLFYVAFGVVISWFVTEWGVVFGQSPLWTSSYATTPFFTLAPIYQWLIRHSYSILFVAFLLGVYKILFSHWVWRIALFWSLLYVQGNRIFGKKDFDQHETVVVHEEEGIHEHS